MLWRQTGPAYYVSLSWQHVAPFACGALPLSRLVFSQIPNSIKPNIPMAGPTQSRNRATSRISFTTPPVVGEFCPDPLVVDLVYERLISPRAHLESLDHASNSTVIRDAHCKRTGSSRESLPWYSRDTWFSCSQLLVSYALALDGEGSYVYNPR